MIFFQLVIIFRSVRSEDSEVDCAVVSDNDGFLQVFF